MKIIIFGDSGFLGSKLKESFAKNNEVIGVSSKDLDAVDKQKVEEFMLLHKPDVVINTVALSSSVQCELDHSLANKLNYQTAENIAEACKKTNSQMVFISSSYVFDGQRGNYSEQDSPSPSNEYAKTKLKAEAKVAELNKFLIIRVDLMYGVYLGKIRAGTSSINGLKEFGCPSQIKSPIFVEDVPVIIEALLKKDQKGIFNLAGEELFKIIDFMKELKSLIPEETLIKITDPTQLIVKPPKNSYLNISKIKSLGIQPTMFKQAKEIIRGQLNIISQNG